MEKPPGVSPNVRFSLHYADFLKWKYLTADYNNTNY